MALETGSRFGDYLLGEKLGQGGYGIVYTARDTKMDREIAVKILRAEQVARPQVVKRFLQEARSAAKIAHPGIVTVYECGEVKGTGTPDDGTVYLAMERLIGEPLGKRLKKGRMEIATAIELVSQVASALEAAHRKGIVHRDLKPDNLFLVPDASIEGGERVKVLDFGIAKLADAEDVTAVHTSSMMMMGTPKYMSPEQCRSTAQVDHRTDVYSLGCILFELLTARTPYVGDAGEQIAKHQLEAVPSMRALAPEVPRSLDKLVVKMLAKKPEDRPETMAKVQEALVVAMAEAGKVISQTVRGLDEPTERDDDRTHERAKTKADLPSRKSAAHGLVLRELTNLDGEQTQPVDRVAEIDKTRVDATPDGPRSSTNPERAATKAPSLDVERARQWWRRREVMVGFGVAVVAVVVVGVVVGRRSATGETTPVLATVAPAASKPLPPKELPPPGPSAATESCDPHVTTRSWDELLACADTLSDRDAAKTLRAQAVLEMRNRDSLEKLGEAIGRKDHADALVWLDRVDDTSVYREEAVTAFAHGLPKPEVALPTCNAAVHTKAAKDKLGAGQYREAVAEIEASLRCAVDPSLYRLGALAACNGRIPVKARMFTAKLPAGQLTTIRQICLRNGVELP